MAPDLSNRSQSPQLPPVYANNRSAQASPNLSRRTSGVMGPPPVPANGSLPTSPRLSTNATAEYQAGTGMAGPIRHPRPLTAAELHLELEKEQESIVNRLTRELSALRAQTASVASTTSSTSDMFTSNPPESHLHPYQSGIIPTTGRRHRSSSNLSSRSARSARDALTSSATATSVSGVAAPRDRDREPSHSLQTSSRPSVDIPRPVISRQNSLSGIAMQRTPSNAAYPFPASTSAHQAHQQQQQYHNGSRHSVSSSYSAHANDSIRSPGSTTTAAAARYEEAALHRAELESVKRENEALKQKIRELERRLSGRRESDRPEATSSATSIVGMTPPAAATGTINTTATGSSVNGG